MQFLSFYCDYEIKGTGTDRRIKGYASVFGNVDAAGDIVSPGAFKRSINDAMTGTKPWPVMLLQHSSDSPVGVWDSIEEDSHGLAVEGRLANTEQGRNVFELLRMKPRPAFSGLSIGYRCTDYTIHGKDSPARRTIKAADLVEVSLVTFPANSKARVLSVKTHVEPVPVVDESALFKQWAREDFEMLRRAHRLAHEPR